MTPPVTPMPHDPTTWTPPDGHLAAAAAALPGPDYYEVLTWIHAALQPRTYVEIGIRDGCALRLAASSTAVVGIDPTPALLSPPAAGTAIVPLTSDRYFAARQLIDDLGGRVELAFIDGLHEFEQALRDFVNVERHCSPDGVILLHDCLPLDDATSARERRTWFYSGDVWKLPLYLAACRPNLRLRIVRTAPTGLCLVGGLEPTSSSLDGHDAASLRRFAALTYADYAACAASRPADVPNTRERVVAALEDVSGRRLSR